MTLHDRTRNLEYMRKCLALWIALASAGLSSSIWAQEVAVVDTTNVHAEERIRPPKPAPVPKPYNPPCPKGREACPPSISVGGACGGVGRLDLVAKFTPFNKSTYAVGEAIPYIVQVENIGKAPIQVPLRKSIREIEPTDPHENYSYRTGGLRFQLRGKDSTYSASPGIPLWGSPQMPDSLATVKPGEWITIKGTITIADWQRVLDGKGEVREQEIAPGTEAQVEIAPQFVSGGAEYFFDAATDYERRVCHPSGSSAVIPLKFALVKGSGSIQK
jgi:hypothetical protein